MQQKLKLLVPNYYYLKKKVSLRNILQHKKMPPSQTSRFVSDTATVTSLMGVRRYILKGFDSSSCFHDLLHSQTKRNHTIVKPNTHTHSSSDFKHVQFKRERKRRREQS